MKTIKNYCAFVLIFLFALNINGSEKKTGTPEVKNPIIPFGAMTGKPTKAQLKKHLDSFKSVGIDQFQIYARSGLELEYMGDEWLDLCGYVIEYAATNGMSIWIYDEYNWPSGSCKGQVVRQNDDFAAKKISVWGNPVTHGKDNYFWSVSTIPLYPDVLSPEAVQTFISLTHEKYYERFGKYFGTVIKGFFTDEPSPMYGARRKTSGSLLELIYWDNLDDEYKQYTQRDFRADVEEHLKGNTPSGLWPAYYHLLGEKFKTSFFDQITSWCDQHDVLFTGHLMDESRPYDALGYNGEPMEVINSFSLPGIDEIFTYTNIDNIEWLTLKMVEDAAINIGTGASAELFALGPCDMTLTKRRQMIWLSALHGIDHYFFSLASLDARANIEKPVYYNPLTVIQPWFGATNELGEDAKQAALFARKKAIQEIAIRYPQNLTASGQFLTEGEKPEIGLRQLIQDLVSWQWNPRLIAEDSSPVSEYKVVLSITQEGFVDEKSGKEFASLDELSSWLDKNIERTTVVERKYGKRLENVLIKNYDDGSVCVISLLDTPLGEVVLKQAGSKPVAFELPEQGVFAYTGQSVPKISNEFKLPVNELLPYTLTSENTIRADFDETGTFEFTLTDNIDKLSIAVRNYEDIVRVKLDGKELSTTTVCHFLPEGLKELYLESEGLSLKAGKHTLSLVTENKDYPYFPSVFIGGNFGGKETVLGKLPETVSIANYREQGLNEYTGSISFSQKVNMGNAEYLSIGTHGLVAEVFIDGKSIGKNAWAPFRWEIPGKYKNKKVELEIRMWTSVGPLFGDYPRDEGKEGSWLKRYAPQ